MAKRKYLKIDLGELFGVSPGRTLVRPKALTVELENRGKDFKLEFKETYEVKQPPANQEWTIDTTLSALEQIRQDLNKVHKYFYYQVKTIKKGYEIMIITDDVFALVAAIMAELLAFGVRDKEDSYNVVPLMEALTKWISKAEIVDG